MVYSAFNTLDFSGREIEILMIRFWLIPLLCLFGVVAHANQQTNIALFYGANPPLAELRAFDVAVVDPDSATINPTIYNTHNHELFAYASVGEVHPNKPYFQTIPKAWLKGTNAAWASQIIDQSTPEWPAFFSDNVIAPLWAKGYRGFFLDTLDSYQLIAKTPEDRLRQETGLKNTIREVKKRWPDAKLIFNRGFEILPDIHDLAWTVAIESLYQGWNPQQQQFKAVSANDQVWIKKQAEIIKQQYHLPVLMIDYVAANDRQLARETAAKIRADGYIPWVSTPSLDMLGVGNVEVLPRKVLVIYNSAESPDLHYADGQRFLSAPLAYLGLSIEYQPFNGKLPTQPLMGRYAGVISWINDDSVASNSDYPRWLEQQIHAGIPIAIFSRLGFSADSALFQTMGLRYQELTATDVLTVQNQDPMMGFEIPVRARQSHLYPIRADANSQPLLTLANQQGQTFHPAAITPWGGYVLSPYTIEELPSGNAGARWHINPLTFLQRALKLDPHHPIADVTTENGRRLLMVHIDGDGFMSLAERANYPFNGEVMLNEVLKRYQIPTTLSAIEGEISPDGLYPDKSAALEKLYQQSFALPWVEIASHSYSHPFSWAKAENADNSEGYHLPLKGYQYSAEREIQGSIDYINNRLAPKDKKVKTLLWTGNCVATPNALAETVKANVLNMNGGDTTITRSQNSWTRIAGLGIPKGGNFQVFAPNQNENVYTKDWTGPFYGFERVIETFELTDKPYRFKPIDIYYHSYIVSKTASLNSLHKVYQWALKQPVFPVYSSEYIQKVLDFNDFVIARTPEGYRFRGNSDLKTVRWTDESSSINFADSPQVAGFNRYNAQNYVHLLDSNADLVTQPTNTTLPYIESTNARISRFVRSKNTLDLSLTGYQPISITFANASKCQLLQGSKNLAITRQGHRLHLEVNAHELTALRLSCRP